MSAKLIFVIIGLIYYAVKEYMKYKAANDEKQKPEKPYIPTYTSPSSTTVVPESSGTKSVSQTVIAHKQKKIKNEQRHVIKESHKKHNPEIITQPEIATLENTSLELDKYSDNYFENSATKIHENFYTKNENAILSIAEITELENAPTTSFQFDLKNAIIGNIILERKYT